MFVTDFEYANKRLSDFGCIMCHINTDSGVRDVDIGCDITFNTIKNNQSSVQYITSSSYENVYSISFEIMKNMCNSDDDEYLTIEEVRRLITWLSRREYRKLKFINTIDFNMNINYYGSFNVKQIMNGNKVLGLSLTFTTNAPYGFEDEVQLEFDTTYENEHFYLSGNSDELGVIYPVVSILFKQDCDLFQIANITTGTTLSLQNCVEGETITIDGEHKIIFTNDRCHKNTLYNDFNYEYLDVIVRDDDFSENIYEVSHPCLITIKYYPIRKVGVY